MKLKEWIALWQEVYDKPAVRPSTYQAHGYLLKNHIVPRLGEMELTEITESIVRRFLNDCHDYGMKPTPSLICVLRQQATMKATSAITSNPALVK